MKKILLMVAVLMMAAISMKAQTAGERSVLTVNLKDGSEATVDLSGLPRGCYIVSVNKRFSFKLLKP